MSVSELSSVTCDRTWLEFPRSADTAPETHEYRYSRPYYSVVQYATVRSRFGSRSNVQQFLGLYEAYRSYVEATTEPEATAATELESVHEAALGGKKSEIAAQLEANKAAIALLEGWLSAEEENDDDARLAEFMRQIDEDRLSDRKLYP